jgi:hypothetical protein
LEALLLVSSNPLAKQRSLVPSLAQLVAATVAAATA